MTSPPVPPLARSTIATEILALGRAATARLWLHLADDGHVPPPSPELREPLARRGAEFPSLVETVARCWPRDTATPLGRLFALLDGDVELLTLLALAAAPLLDGGLARTYDALTPRAQLTFGILLELATTTESERLHLGARVGGSALVTRAIVEFDPTLGVATTTPIQLPAQVIAALRGGDIPPPTQVLDAVAPGHWPEVDLSQVGLPDAFNAPILLTGTSPLALETVARVLAGRAQQALWICSLPVEAERTSLVLAWTRLLRDAALAGALVACDLLPEREPEPQLAARRISAVASASRRIGAPAVLFMASEEHLPSWAARDLIVVQLKSLPLEAANAFAEARLHQEGVADAAALVERSIAPLAIAVGQVEPIIDCYRRGVLESDSAAARTELAEALRPKLGNLVDRVTRRAPWDALIVTEDLMIRLREVVLYRKHAEQVYRTWGLGRHITGEGVAALFTGPPGTGKSLAATVIATDLGIPLYRVDLSRIVSKWVGETEKNLAQLFAESRSGRAVLLFDEADSLFGKRTDVKSSNDRYANLEVNFLLQKLDEFDGIAILTSNAPNAIDAAFMRRLQFRCHFEKPDENARLALWMQHLPAPEHLADDVNLDELAHEYDFSGGNIRNAAIRAAFLAAEERVLLGPHHLNSACITEAEELGRVVRRELTA